LILKFYLYIKMVPRARGDAKRRQADIVYREKMQEALVAGR